MSTSHHTVPATHHTTTTGAVHDKNLVHDKHAVHHNEHVKDEFNGTRGTTSSADHLRQDGLVKTGGYTTGLEAAHGTAAPSGHAVPVTAYNQGVVGGVPITNQPTAGAQFQNTVPNAANRDGLVVNDGIGGARGGAAILGGQCECTMNGGHCAHGAGNCVCRGCTTKATTINPGINIGVSTTQYTAPAGTSGIGGGVMERGTGIAGLVHANTQPTVPVDAAHQHCECVKKNGACTCAPGTCACTNCSALRAAELAKAKAHQEKEKHAHGHHHDKDTHHHGHTAAAATTAAATTHAATHAHTSTHPVATTTAHSTAVPVATGATTGAHMTTHSNNIDGDGHNQTHFGQGSTVGAPVQHSATTGSTVTGAHTGQSNISHLNTASSSTKSAEHVEAGSEYASGAVHPSHVNRGAAGASIPSDPSIEHGTASSPRPITDNSDVSYLKSSQ